MLLVFHLARMNTSEKIYDIKALYIARKNLQVINEKDLFEKIENLVHAGRKIA